MATINESSKLLELFECSICCEIFNKPKCGHTIIQQLYALQQLRKLMQAQCGRYVASLTLNDHRPLSEHILSIFPPASSERILYLDVSNSAHNDYVNYCTPAYFTENLDNLGLLFFNGQGLEKYPEGIHINVVSKGGSIPKAFCDDLIKGIKTTKLPERAVKHFYIYSCDLSLLLPNWWTENANAVQKDGRFYKLERIVTVTNENNGAFKFAIKIRSDLAMKRMGFLGIERL